ncbi:MAG TPA: hypothetical protein VFM35_02660, partial [Candidatus Binatia bacterium]|nr:hypothetical protein [Candidatus Binatia bacterium]
MSNLNVPLTSPLPGPPADARLSGRKLIIIRAVWVLITILVLGLVITAIPIRYEKVRTDDPNIRAPEFRDLIEVGVSPEMAASLDLGAAVLMFLTLFGGGILLFWRGSDSKEVV